MPASSLRPKSKSRNLDKNECTRRRLLGAFYGHFATNVAEHLLPIWTQQGRAESFSGGPQEQAARSLVPGLTNYMTLRKSLFSIYIPFIVLFSIETV